MPEQSARIRNICPRCDHSWLPRGREFSPRCPNCGARLVWNSPGLLRRLVGYVSAFAILGFVFICGGCTCMGLIGPWKETTASAKKTKDAPQSKDQSKALADRARRATQTPSPQPVPPLDQTAAAKANKSDERNPIESPNKPPTPQPATRTVKIKTYTPLALFRLGVAARGPRVRVSGKAAVRPSAAGGAYVQFVNDSGRAMVRASIAEGDSGPLEGKLAQAGEHDIILEGEVLDGTGATCIVEYARLAWPDDPDEYTEEAPAEKEPGTLGIIAGPLDKNTSPSTTASKGSSSATPASAGPIVLFVPGRPISVKGYTRRDGTIVRPHLRIAPRAMPRSGGRR